MHKRRLKNDLYQLYIGGAGTGAPFHHHSHAWNALLYGERASLGYAWDARPRKHGEKRLPHACTMSRRFGAHVVSA